MVIKENSCGKVLKKIVKRLSAKQDVIRHEKTLVYKAFLTSRSLKRSMLHTCSGDISGCDPKGLGPARWPQHMEHVKLKKFNSTQSVRVQKRKNSKVETMGIGQYVKKY